METVRLRVCDVPIPKLVDALSVRVFRSNVAKSVRNPDFVTAHDLKYSRKKSRICLRTHFPPLRPHCLPRLRRQILGRRHLLYPIHNLHGPIRGQGFRPGPTLRIPPVHRRPHLLFLRHRAHQHPCARVPAVVLTHRMALKDADESASCALRRNYPS
jgi:hypothetical protein